MRRFLISLVFVLFVCLAGTSEARKLALLVGVDAYDEVPSLECCVNDVKVLKDALMKVGFQDDDIQILATSSDNYPTKKRIERKLREIFEMAGPHDMVFLSFSGHGAQDGKKVYFCPPDVDVDDLDGTCVSIDQVMRDLEKCKAQFKWVVVDACRNDPADAARSIGGKGLQVIPTPPAGIALFQSCAKGEQSWEDRTSGNGFFTKNFAAALSGAADANHDGQLTLMEVCTWTTAQTKEQVMASQNKSQKPYFSGTVSDFTLTEDLNVPKAKALAEEAQKAMDTEDYKLAIEKYDAALALCPQFENWKRERELAQRFLKRKPTGPTLPRSPQAGDRAVLKVDDVEFAFRWCPPGEFMMGSPTDEPGRYDNEKRHRVRLTRGFWLLETEVTQAQWKAIMGTSLEEQAQKMLNDDTEYDFGGSIGKKTLRDLYGFQRDTPSEKILCGVGSDRPIYFVNWNESVEFCRRLSSRLNQRIQLPTEAQWEYACRAGSATALPNGPFEIKGQCNAPALDPIAWYGGNSSQGFTGQSALNSSGWPETQYPGGPCGAHPVGKKDANAWGLYDMIGNVFEWCSDYYDADYYDRSPTSDPENTTASSDRVIRGGSWFIIAGNCRSAHRDRGGPGSRYGYLGLRVLLVPSQD